ncbi:sulfite exporter TauE/SafE family protein [Amycolatopsis thermoflava]|uniref:sulfite exporter TauE/SafE family protein n=1 Tax=Amycolatopsis thermoflava TaxID=84480 RepID=UPI00380DFA3C
MLIAAALAGLLIGLALGLLGAGGSILAVPALVYAAGQPLAAAVPASLLIVGVSSATAVVPRLRTRAVRWPIALVFGAAGIPAAFGGAALGRLLPPRVLLLGFAALMAVVAVRMLTEHRSSGGACRTSGGRINWRACLPKALAAGAVVGVLTGLFGVGGGFLIVPALTLLLGVDAAQAVATSLVIIVINSAAGLAAHAGTPMDWTTTGILGGTAILAALAAGRLSTRLPERVVRHGFAYLVLIISAAIAVTAIVAPATLPTR